MIEDILNKLPNCYIFGSYIYKYKLNGEKYNDIDIIVPYTDVEITSKILENIYNCVTMKKWLSYDKEYVKLKCNFNNEEVEIDLYDDITMQTIWNRDKNEYGKILYRDNKFYHLDCINRDNTISNSCDEKLKEIIKNIRLKKYKKWNNMRKKDKEYFKDWKLF